MAAAANATKYHDDDGDADRMIKIRSCIACGLAVVVKRAWPNDAEYTEWRVKFSIRLLRLIV